MPHPDAGTADSNNNEEDTGYYYGRMQMCSAGFFVNMTSKNYYKECLETMYGLRRFGIKLGLDTILNILSGLGNPQNHFKTIHVAGTNGKGSTASTLSMILSSSGYKTGLYTSPHLVRFNERICINNRPVSDEAVIEAYEAVNNVPQGEREPTFFEFATAMALHIFAKEKTDWAVIETGMGGRLDATNVIQPELSIISNISLEHQEYLGNTIAQIAAEKGGIIKENIPVVTGVHQESAIEALKEIAKQKNAPIYRFGDEFRAVKNGHRTFTYSGIENTWPDIRTGLAGNHQIDNAALVLASCELLNQKGAGLSIETIRNGIKHNRWPGRLEVVSESPFTILDGAHNLAAVEKLAAFLSEELSDRDITLIVGILDDKPYKEMLGYLLPLCHKVILTRPVISRALPVETLYETAKGMIQNIEVIPNIEQAVNYAMETAGSNDAICIAGSLYVVGEAKECLEKKGFPSFM